MSAPTDDELNAARALYYRDHDEEGTGKQLEWDALSPEQRQPWLDAVTRAPWTHVADVEGGGEMLVAPLGTPPPMRKPPRDRQPKADDGTRNVHAEQLVDKVIERAGSGTGVVAFIGTMLGQLGEFVTNEHLEVEWESALIYAKRTDAAGVEAETHNIIPKGTLVLVLDVNVRPQR